MIRTLRNRVRKARADQVAAEEDVAAKARVAIREIAKARWRNGDREGHDLSLTVILAIDDLSDHLARRGE